MAFAPPTGHHAAMPHDPALDLYDRSCTLLDAAQQLETAAGVPGGAPAAAATLGCLEAALDAVARAVDALRAEVSDHTDGERPEDRDATWRSLIVLSAMLEVTTAAAADARVAVGPVVSRTALRACPPLSSALLPLSA